MKVHVTLGDFINLLTRSTNIPICLDTNGQTINCYDGKYEEAFCDYLNFNICSIEIYDSAVFIEV